MDNYLKKEIKRLLLSHDEMDRRYLELGANAHPYCYEIERNDQVLFYFGAEHILGNEEHHQFDQIKNYFERFLAKTLNKDCIAIVEGNGNILLQSEKEAKLAGETTFTTFLAHQFGIGTISPEPSQLDEIHQLMQVFHRDEIMYYYFARIVNYFKGVREKSKLEEFIKTNYTQRFKVLTGWNDFDFSYEHAQKLHDRFHSHFFDIDNPQCFYNDSNPYTNKVASFSSHYRDIAIVSEVMRLWQKGKNIFVVYGSGHAIVQEKALKKLLLD